MWISKQPASVPATPTDAAELREYLGRFAVPRHFHAQSQQNTRIGDAIARLLSDFGYEVWLQGRYRNVLARPRGVAGPYFLIGAHFDSVPGTQGADDNGSGLAVLLAVARALAGKNLPILIAAFNSEEDGLLGSADFAANCVCTGQLALQGAHILEMVGYCSRKRDSQRSPIPYLPGVPTVGDFLGLLGRGPESALLRKVLKTAAASTPELSVIGLRTFFGIDKLLPVLHRSDHSPLWAAGVPALMWTDTAEFRNPNYHQGSDQIKTLDFSFMQSISTLLQNVVIVTCTPVSPSATLE